MPTADTDAYAKFGGRVERTASMSRPWWPARPQPPYGAPNVVIILADDLGYSDLGCFGSEIRTPNIDRLAAEGARYSNFHVAPSCSPSRASLLTGLNCHAAGFGYPAQIDPGFPGYAMELGPDAITAAEIFRASGYSTMMVGKWHLAREADSGAGGDRRSWPLERGFDRFYGALHAFSDYFAPHQLIEDNHPVRVEQYPEDYYLTDDLTDRAVTMLREQQAAYPGRPFFLYVAHGAVHGPLQAKPEDVARHRERYSVGWDEIRRGRFERQLELGLFPTGTNLPPRNWETGHDVPAWADLDADSRTVFARYMAVYAAMIDNLDQNVGRLLGELDALDVRDNTVVLFLSDNGASREGGPSGTTSYHQFHAPYYKADIATDLARLDLIGGPKVHAMQPRGWAMASNTPFRLYKMFTHAGAHQVPLIVTWPQRLGGKGLTRGGYTHVTDILPTLLDIAGLETPTERRGVPVQPLVGTTFAPSLIDPSVQTQHGAQYYEAVGHRSYYRDGWEVVALNRPGAPIGDQDWELYHLDHDPTESEDLAANNAERVRALSNEWEHEAWANRVFPLVDDFRIFQDVRPNSDVQFELPVRIRPGTAALDRYRSVKLVQHRSFTISAHVELQQDDEGVLVSHGNQSGGYILYVEKGCLVYGHRALSNDCELRTAPLQSGTKRLTVVVMASPGWRWSVRLHADDLMLAQQDDLPGFAGRSPAEGIEIGISGRSPVSWSLRERRGPFPWNGVLHYVEYTPGELVIDSPSALVRQPSNRHQR